MLLPVSTSGKQKRRLDRKRARYPWHATLVRHREIFDYHRGNTANRWSPLSGWHRGQERLASNKIYFLPSHMQGQGRWGWGWPRALEISVCVSNGRLKDKLHNNTLFSLQDVCIMLHCAIWKAITLVNCICIFTVCCAHASYPDHLIANLYEITQPFQQWMSSVCSYPPLYQWLEYVSMPFYVP